MEIGVYAMVLGFQKRCLWQVSSLVQQQPWNGQAVPQLRYVASVSRRDLHWEWNDRLVRTFRSTGIFSLDEWPADDERYGRRGHIRTHNLRTCPYEWAVFVDADVVYHPQFWAQLASKLPAHAGCPKVLAAPRMSMSFEDGYGLVDGHSYSDLLPVSAAYERTLARRQWPSAHGRISGAGFFQAVHVPAVREHLQRTYGAVFYCAPTWNRDHNTFATTHITRSDRLFRMICGGIVPLPDLLPQVHLNHYRKNDPEWQSKGLH